MLDGHLLVLEGDFDGIDFWFAASMRSEEDRFGRNIHGNGAIYFFEEGVDDGE